MLWFFVGVNFSRNGTNDSVVYWGSFVTPITLIAPINTGIKLSG